mmetsp:Transcript_2252/g.3947  ORF Transcript_2252/g.3947 Transcript_2252/m.3947 type:complete len:210 (-) Transcript_2252:1252-1881(-)
MAISVDFFKPSCPFILMYIQEMGKIAALPNGAPAMAPSNLGTHRSLPQSFPEASGSTAWPGRKGARWDATPIEPTPGPPPPWGMQNVLCRLRWQTSAPMIPGLVKPTCAFIFAPSMYTCPPASWTISMISTIFSSNTPKVLGYVTMNAATFSLCFSTFALKSSKSIFPSSSLSTTTTFIPAMVALAGLVPCALLGIRQTLRCPCPICSK